MGETTTRRRVVGAVDAVVLDCGAIRFDEDGGHGGTFAGRLAGDTAGGFWLRLCANVHRSGTPVVPFAGGLGLPERVEGRPESRYFPRTASLAPICAPDERRRRIRARPGRASVDPDARNGFDDPLCERGTDPDSPVETVGTTDRSPAGTTDAVGAWVRSSL